MKRFYLTSFLTLCLAACATEPPSQPASESTVRATSARATAEAETSAATDDDEGIVVVDTPNVPKVAVTEEEFEVPNGGERVCRLERRTGTHRARRVCYTRTEIERMAIKSKEAFDDLNRSQVEY